MLIILIFINLFFWAAPAHAYLDPSSGSALVTSLIAAASGFLYKIKSAFYYFFGSGKKTERQVQDDGLIIFSEGKNYWGTFRLIVEELIQRKIHFRYITLDLHDPGLEIESDYMQAKLLKNNSSGFTYFKHIKAQVMLSTTPNIGAKGFPLQKPASVNNLMHVFHSVADISVYHKFSLDAYDSVLLSGDFQRQSIRTIEKKRNLKEKTLLPAGLPYLDEMYKQLNKASTNRHLKKPTILIGSSWGMKGCLKSYGIDFIATLAKKGYAIIIRPHPQSYISEPDFIHQSKAALEQFSDITWDKAPSPLNAMQSSNILISDTSSIRFDYAFLLSKPVITLDIPRENLEAFEAHDLEEIWTDWASERIGTVISKKSIDTLPVLVSDILGQENEKDIKELRSEMVANWANSSKHIVDHMLDISSKEVKHHA